MRCLYCVGFSFTLLLLDAVASERQENWNQSRGPYGDGKSLATNLPVEFSETKNVRWKTPIHDHGWSSPVVWGDQIWLTSGREDGKELFAICVDLQSGEVIHDIKGLDVADPSMEWSDQNPHACPTPFIEQGRVYVHYGSYGTACIDTDSGETIWKRQDLQCNHRVGPASSPIVAGGTLFLQFDGVDVQYVAALDKATGDTLWTKPREVTSDLATLLRQQGLSDRDIQGTLVEKPGDNRKSYATPTLIEYANRQQLISPGAEVLFSYDPKTGEELWRVEHTGWAWNVACRPILAHGLVYATTGISKKLLAIQPSGRGDVTQSNVAWSCQRGVPNLSSPVIVDDLLFVVTDDGGIVTCLNALTGKQVWRQRLGGNHWASPIYADGKIYFSSKEGEVAVLAASKSKPEVLATNKLNAEFIASPAVAGDSLVLRSTTHLYCFANDYQRSAEDVAADVYPKRNQRGKKAYGKEKSDVDWESAYERLLRTNAKLRDKVESGETTKEKVIEWMMKSQADGKKAAK